ncbi:hypothetical protein [Variovorax sp. WS11]|uniref:hypothetical protein n=1 Tax=Variovorax sp. WS11 TaxID=1105204 RepID=UPI0013DD1AD3|nr:hypothetical protein [Variovorax sp. WS11]NDZ18433.1 hypothetical protein [Variovorax sp. WS11]
MERKVILREVVLMRGACPSPSTREQTGMIVGDITGRERAMEAGECKAEAGRS